MTLFLRLLLLLLLLLLSMMMKFNIVFMMCCEIRGMVVVVMSLFGVVGLAGVVGFVVGVVILSLAVIKGVLGGDDVTVKSNAFFPPKSFEGWRG